MITLMVLSMGFYYPTWEWPLDKRFNPENHFQIAKVGGISAIRACRQQLAYVNELFPKVKMECLQTT